MIYRLTIGQCWKQEESRRWAEGEQEMSGRWAGDDRKASGRWAEGAQERSRRFKPQVKGEWENEAVVDTLIGDQAECTLMSWVGLNWNWCLHFIRKSLERGDKAVVDTLIRDQAEFTECRLMLWLIPKEGTKNWKASRRWAEGEQERSGKRAGDERKASRRWAEG